MLGHGMCASPARILWRGRGRRGVGLRWVRGWVGILPTVAFAFFPNLARRIDGQFFEFLVDGPSSDRLLSLLNPLKNSKRSD